MKILITMKRGYNNSYLKSGKVVDSDGYSEIVEKQSYDVTDQASIQRELGIFREKYETAEVEHALIISKDGNIYEIKGTERTVTIGLTGEEAFRGSHVIHNHLTSSFETTADLFSFEDIMGDEAKEHTNTWNSREEPKLQTV